MSSNCCISAQALLFIPALSDLYRHGAGHHVSRCQIFSVGSVTLHETLSLAVDQDPSLATAALCDQTTSSIDPCKDSHIDSTSAHVHRLNLVWNGKVYLMS